MIINKSGGQVPTVEIKAQKASEKDKPMFIHKKEDDILYLPIETVFVLDGGMRSGSASVTLYGKYTKETGEEVHVMLETSHKMLNAITNTVNLEVEIFNGREDTTKPDEAGSRAQDDDYKSSEGWGFGGTGGYQDN